MYFIVSEGKASFMMGLELYFYNGLNFDAAFPCLLAELENSVKETGKNAGMCEDCQHAAVM